MRTVIIVVLSTFLLTLVGCQDNEPMTDLEHCEVQSDCEVMIKGTYLSVSNFFEEESITDWQMTSQEFDQVSDILKDFSELPFGFERHIFDVIELLKDDSSLVIDGFDENSLWDLAAPLRDAKVLYDLPELTEINNNYQHSFEFNNNYIVYRRSENIFRVMIYKNIYDDTDIELIFDADVNTLEKTLRFSSYIIDEMYHQNFDEFIALYKSNTQFTSDIAEYTFNKNEENLKFNNYSVKVDYLDKDVTSLRLYSLEEITNYYLNVNYDTNAVTYSLTDLDETDNFDDTVMEYDLELSTLNKQSYPPVITQDDMVQGNYTQDGQVIFPMGVQNQSFWDVFSDRYHKLLNQT
ncbi:MAG: hypothetical protein UMR38_02905 [Candidatus Izemoplasma sp.]|nr:hypothetical protein [Candidatus Izemoplasma sp.]